MNGGLVLGVEEVSREEVSSGGRRSRKYQVVREEVSSSEKESYRRRKMLAEGKEKPGSFPGFWLSEIFLFCFLFAK